ncbi:hypothetical protein CBM2585_A160173 [Cupriavidus taiwanensis]|nr:hypothetical protein CBM2585_A160173 [Cupriavidus taiwanensis]
MSCRGTFDAGGGHWHGYAGPRVNQSVLYLI